MLGYWVNKDRASFEQQGENNDDESVSASASLPSPPSYGTLPSVPSYGTEDWHYPDLSAVADASTTSASPMSPCFPGFASGSSAGVVRSYSTTPLSSTSLEIPKNGPPLRFESPLLFQSAELNAKKHTKFILEDPTMARPKKDKAMRSCTSCFTKRWECPESETPSRCVHCVGKTSYCKGPIKTPRLFDPKRFDVVMAALLRPHYQSIDIHLDGEILGPMQVYLKVKPSSEQEIMSESQTYRLELPGLQYDLSFRKGPSNSNLNDVLDAILSADVPLCIAHKPGLYDLSSFERLCRRLCVCISLLRRLDNSTLDKVYKNDRRSVRVVVGFLCQLSRLASSIFEEIYDHIRGCCFASRDRGTPKLMIILAEHLGFIHKEIRGFMHTEKEFSDPQLPLAELLYNGVQTLDGLENLGRGLCARAFEATYQSSDLDVGGVHLVPCFEPRGCDDTDDLCTLSQHDSFLDILRDYAPHHYPNDPPIPIMCSNDAVRPWQNFDIEDPNLSAGHGSQDGIGATQNTIIEDHVPFGVEGLQEQALAMLDPSWTLELDNFAVTQSADASVNTDHFHASVFDNLPQGQPVLWGQQLSGVQQASHDYFPGFPPLDTDTTGGMLRSLSHMMAPSQVKSVATPELEPVDNTALLGIEKPLHSMPVPSIPKVPKRASKRKAIKDAFSRKKPCLTPSHPSHSEDSRASTSKIPPKLGLGIGFAAKTTITNNMMLSERPSDDFQKATPRESIREQVNNTHTKLDKAGVVREIKGSNSERRPMSWPHRNTWRKSLDLSTVLPIRFRHT